MTKRTFVSTKVFKKTAKEDPGKLKDMNVRKHFVDTEIKQEGDEANRELRFIISTGSVDRMLDTINPKGWKLQNYKKNPVVLFAHDSGQPPIGKAIKIGIEDDALKATAKFVERDISPFADMIYRMCQEGYLRATSVGFDPIEWKFADPEDEDRNDGWWTGIDFEKQELLEFSIVPVPANPDCIIEAKTKGIDVAPLQGWFEEALDQWADYKGLLLIPRKQVETFYKACTGRTVSKHLSEEEQADLLAKNLKAVKESAAPTIEDSNELEGSVTEEAVEIVEAASPNSDEAPTPEVTASDEPVVEKEEKQCDNCDDPNCPGCDGKKASDDEPEDDEDDEEEDEEEKSTEVTTLKIDLDTKELVASLKKNLKEVESVDGWKQFEDTGIFTIGDGKNAARVAGMKLLDMKYQKAGGFIFTFGFGELDSIDNDKSHDDDAEVVKTEDVTTPEVISEEEPVVLLLEDSQEETIEESPDPEDEIEIDEDTAKLIDAAVAEAVAEAVRKFKGKLD